MAADAGGDGRCGGAGDDGGGARDRTAVLETNGGAGDERAALDKATAELSARRRRRRSNCQIWVPVRLYRGGPFNTGPWLEPMLKGL